MQHEHLMSVFQIFERALGESHPDCASLLVDCGVALYGQGKYRMALLRLEAALKIRKAKSGARCVSFFCATGYLVKRPFFLSSNRLNG
jgi:hypothetical protein